MPRTMKALTICLSCIAGAALAACATSSHKVQDTQATAQGPATAAEAKDFVAKVNTDLKDLWFKASTAEWIKATYITDDTERQAAWANDVVLAYLNEAVEKAKRYQDVKDLDPESARAIQLLRLSSALPPPADARHRAELTEIAAKLEGMYGKGQWCGPDGNGKCRNLEELSDVMAKSRKYDELLDAWVGWHTISRPMKSLYVREVELSNEGAKNFGFADVGDLWRAGYDMSAADFEKETDRLWEQVKPLYTDLHCYVRSKLVEKYGKDRVPEHGPIPAHLLGNMWAQEWQNVYDLVTPYKGQGELDVSKTIEKKKLTPEQMVHIGESFFDSLGLGKLPDSFWKNSQFTKPRDREVVCHASAWDVSFAGDLRIKMCIKPNEEDLETIHHELGHDYYYKYYNTLPAIFQAGANDGFHEAIGDTMILSMTPAYLKQLGLLDKLPQDDKGLINVQMRQALSGIAFLPFGKLIDQWRWDVYSGKVKPANYNAAWWELRQKYQGVAAPVQRTEDDFDPGAKYHVPANVPYTRYFLARILQYQFHKALCDASGFKGPLHQCSIFGSKAAGDRLKAMLALGASKPWQDALEAMTGSRQMDASAILEYYAPLRSWLQEQNKGKSCGW
jgi:peptidyl-dipeptidase A